MIIIKNISVAGKSLLLIFFIAFFHPLNAQDPTNIPIKQIVIIGNDITDDNVILRELLLQTGDIPTQETMNESYRRLMNLYLFNRVEMKLYPQDTQGLLLVIEVTEQIYFYPLPIFTFHDRDWDKYSYGVSVINMNFRGQNERLWAGIWLGYRPGFGIKYTDQWAGDSLHLTTGFSLMKATFDHRTLGFYEHHVYGAASVGKWWGYHFNTSLSFHFDRIKVAEYYKYLMHSGKSTEYIFGIELSVRYDTRDLYSYPSNGWYNRFNIFKYGLFENYNDYIKTVIDIRKYITIGPIIIAGRLMQNSLFGEVPIYRMNYIGFSERVRGHFYNVREGKHVQIAGIETRFNIIPIRYFSFNLPAIPAQYLTNLKIGLSAALFIDTGIVWDKSNEYKYDNFSTGFGLGLHLHLPYVEVFRFDYGFDRNWRGQLTMEVGVVF